MVIVMVLMVMVMVMMVILMVMVVERKWWSGVSGVDSPSTLFAGEFANDYWYDRRK